QERQPATTALSGYGEAAGNKLAAFGASTDAAQAQKNSLLDLLKALSGQQTQRDISGGQLGLGYGELAERMREANIANTLEKQRTNLAQGAQNSIFNKLLAGLGGIGQFAGGLGGLIGGINAGRTVPGRP